MQITHDNDCEHRLGHDCTCGASSYQFDLAKARAEIERLTKERDEALALLADAYGAGTGGSVIEAHLADAERDMRQRAADSCLGLMTAQSARKFILALPLKHADREARAALAQGQKEGA